MTDNERLRSQQTK